MLNGLAKERATDSQGMPVVAEGAEEEEGNI